MYTFSCVFLLCWFTMLEYFSLFLLTCLWIYGIGIIYEWLWDICVFSARSSAAQVLYIQYCYHIVFIALGFVFSWPQSFFRGSLLNFVSISVVFLLFLSSSMRVWFEFFRWLFCPSLHFSVSVHSSTCFCTLNSCCQSGRRKKSHIILFCFFVKCMRCRRGERKKRRRKANWRTPPVLVLRPRNGRVRSMNVRLTVITFVDFDFWLK